MRWISRSSGIVRILMVPSISARAQSLYCLPYASTAAPGGEGDNGLVAQPFVRLEAAGLRQARQAVQALSHPPAKAAGAGTLVKGQPQLVLRVCQGGLLLFRLVDGDGLGLGGPNQAPTRPDH